jgi:hypothetical protein
MHSTYKTFASLVLILSSFQGFASPKQLITHNQTDLESNAYVAGTIPSRYPTRAYSDNRVNWLEVRMACFGHITNNKCPALIRIGTGPNDGGTPMDLGFVTMDLVTGSITPNELHAYGYTFTVNGPGETTITKDN